jgi:hypothetical protein
VAIGATFGVPFFDAVATGKTLFFVKTSFISAVSATNVFLLLIYGQ